MTVKNKFAHTKLEMIKEYKFRVQYLAINASKDRLIAIVQKSPPTVVKNVLANGMFRLSFHV